MLHDLFSFDLSHVTYSSVEKFCGFAGDAEPRGPRHMAVHRQKRAILMRGAHFQSAIRLPGWAGPEPVIKGATMSGRFFHRERQQTL